MLKKWLSLYCFNLLVHVVGMGTQYHINPGVKRTVVRWEHIKRTEFNCALNNNTEGFEKVNTLLDNVLTNISEATKDVLMSWLPVNELLLRGVK